MIMILPIRVGDFFPSSKTGIFLRFSPAQEASARFTWNSAFAASFAAIGFKSSGIMDDGKTAMLFQYDHAIRRMRPPRNLDQA
jgi:hypothetical protein